MKLSVRFIDNIKNRPTGLVIISSLFVLLSLVDSAIFLINGDSWWVVNLSLSLIIMFLLRNIWNGSDRERKTAVFLGFLIAIMDISSTPDGNISQWAISELLNPVEGIYALCSALYLIHIKQHSFFTSKNVL